MPRDGPHLQVVSRLSQFRLPVDHHFAGYGANKKVVFSLPQAFVEGPSRATQLRVRLTMHRIVNALAVASIVLTICPSIVVAAEAAPAAVNGTWTNVTPIGVDLADDLPCGNYGSITMAADPARPSELYTQFHCQGVWKSTDYGLTWFGPINTGQGGAGASGAGGLAIARGPDGQPPILYAAGIRGTGLGFWKSVDGGVSWTNYRVVAWRRSTGFLSARRRSL